MAGARVWAQDVGRSSWDEAQVVLVAGAGMAMWRCKVVWPRTVNDTKRQAVPPEPD